MLGLIEGPHTLPPVNTRSTGDLVDTMVLKFFVESRRKSV